MSAWHPLLERQLKKYLWTPVPPLEMGALLDAVSRAYREFDEDRRMLERSMEISSQELYQANTDLKASAEKIKTAYDKLQKTYAQLVQSEKMSAVGQLAAGVAHEINNPLGVILGFAQGVVRRIPPGDSLEMPLKSIEREAVRCKNLVQDLLAFSRAGKKDKEKTDLNVLIESSLSLVLANAKVKNIEMTKELASDLPPIFASRNQIQQVIVNLCNNAMDAMGPGGRLTLRTEKYAFGGKQAIQLQVRDTGSGIPKEIQSKIFEPFFTTKEVGKGTGLGLSLVYEIIQEHQGQVTLESREGQGTVFFITLPAHKDS